MIPLIYVAGRYRGPTREAIAQNIDAARQVGVAAALLGWYPVIPHANTAHMELNTPHGDDFWLDGTLELMTRCDAVVLVPGWESSEGTKGEIAKAAALGIPVFYQLDDLPTAGEFETYSDPINLQLWFGLGRDSFATLPRVIMEAMPPAWQAAMGKLLLEYDEAFVNRPDLEAIVIAKRDGKFTKMPEWVTNYRHPDTAVINHAMGRE